MTRDPDGFPAFAEMSGGDPEPPEPAASPSSRRLPCLGALGVALVSALGAFGVLVWVVGALVRWVAA